MKDVRFFILIGNPGAGKTWIGELLARRLGLIFLDLERMFLARYGDVENFLRHKPEALEWFEEQVCGRAGRETVVFEAGPFSQEQMVRRLQQQYCTVVVSVDAPREVRRERIRTRTPGRHFTDDPEEKTRYDHVYEREIKPRFDFAFQIENAGLSEVELLGIVQEESSRLGLRLVGS